MLDHVDKMINWLWHWNALLPGMRVWIIAWLCLQEASINRSLDDCWTNCTEMLVLCGREMTELEFQEVEKYRYHFCKIGVIGRKMLYLGLRSLKSKGFTLDLWGVAYLIQFKGGVSAEVMSFYYQIQDKQLMRAIDKTQTSLYSLLMPAMAVLGFLWMKSFNCKEINQQMFSKENAEWSCNIFRQNLRSMLKYL